MGKIGPSGWAGFGITSPVLGTTTKSISSSWTAPSSGFVPLGRTIASPPTPRPITSTHSPQEGYCPDSGLTGHGLGASREIGVREEAAPPASHGRRRLPDVECLARDGFLKLDPAA